MTNKKILELANFFYSSDDSRKVPLRVAITTGRYSAFDLSREDFIELFKILNKSENLKTDLKGFLEVKKNEEDD